MAIGGRHLLENGFENGFSENLSFFYTPLKLSNQEIMATIDPLTGLLIFSKNKTNVCGGLAQLPNGYLPNTEIRPHLHIRAVSGQPNPTTGHNSVHWRLRYKWYNKTDMLPVNYTEDNMTVNLPPHQSGNSVNIGGPETAFAVIDGTGRTCNSLIEWTLMRHSDTDTYTGNVILVDFDIYYRHYSYGSLYILE